MRSAGPTRWTAATMRLSEALREVTAQLKVYGTEGRKGQLDAAQTEREHAEADYLRMHRRARAAQLLRSVMARHRDATRLRYVDPFRNQVERLGRIVFGDSFEVEIDSALRICSRTLAGRTVPYESLSGGAKEQMGIVARLAGAVLVAKEDGVPVVIDDALGFTDADRLTKMGAVFNAVGGDGQVIVLTCSPAALRQRGRCTPHRADGLAARRAGCLGDQQARIARQREHASHRVDRRGVAVEPHPPQCGLALGGSRAQPRGDQVGGGRGDRDSGLTLRGCQTVARHGELEAPIIDLDAVRGVQVAGLRGIEGQQDAREKSVQRRQRAVVRHDHVEPECRDRLHHRQHLAPAPSR